MAYIKNFSNRYRGRSTDGVSPQLIDVQRLAVEKPMQQSMGANFSVKGPGPLVIRRPTPKTNGNALANQGINAVAKTDQVKKEAEKQGEIMSKVISGKWLMIAGTIVGGFIIKKLFFSKGKRKKRWL